MRGPLAACLGAVVIAGCSAFVSLDGLRVDDGGVDGGGDGAADAAADTNKEAGPDSPPVPACPSTRGSPMIEFNGHCIDAFEASYQQYLAFMASLDGGVMLPPECAFKTNHAPDQIPGDLTLPVAYTDWCDAWAFCKWAGKELCGGIDGGSFAVGDYADPKKSLWMSACTHDGQNRYPYGSSFDPAGCRLTYDPDSGTDQGSATSGSTKKCEGGYPGIFDMVGNMREWENACTGTTGPNDDCRRRGGSFTDENADYVDCAHDTTYPRDYRSQATGFRCCAKPQ